MKRNKSEFRDAIRKQIKTPLRTFFGYDEIEDIELLRSKNEPFLYIDHAYFARGYHNNNFRIILNTIHQTQVLDLDARRRKMFAVELKDWNQGERIVFIPAPKNPLIFHRDTKWNMNTIDRLCALTSREIYVKDRKDDGMGEVLNNCWAVVTHSSVAGVEAAINGVPVICTDKCPAWEVGASVENIETPIMPDRDKWVNTLTYSQFTLKEMQDGSAWSIIKEMYSL